MGNAVLLRIRPSRIRACKVRVPRAASGADAALALLFSMIFEMLGAASFTMLCWRVGWDLGQLPVFPIDQGFLSQRESWLLFALLAWLFAKLIGTFAELLKSPSREADELRAERIRIPNYLSR